MHKIKKHTFIFIIFLIGIVLSNCSKQNVCNKDSSETSTCSGISSRNIGGSGSNPSGGTYPIQQVITASVSTKNIQAQLGIPIYFTINFKTSTSTATNLEVKSSDVNWTIDNTSCKLVTTDNDDCLIKFTSTPTALTNPENKPVNLPISYTYIGDDNKSYSGSIADVTYEVFSSAPTSQVTAIISSLNNMSQVGVPFSFNIKFNTKTKATNLKVILTDNNWTQSMTDGCKLINNSGNCRVTFTNQASVATTPSNTPVNLPISYSFLGDDNNQHSESITGINYEIDSPSAPPSISQVNVTVSVGDTIAKGIRIQQGAIVPSFTFTFSVTAGSVTNLKVQSSDTNLVIPANSNTCLALTPSSESCALTFNYNPKDLISPIIFPLTFSYKDGSTSYTKTLNGFTYEVVSSPIAAVNISHGRINTLTLNASNDILVNSDKSSQEPTLPSNYLSELKSDLTPGSDTYGGLTAKTYLRVQGVY